MENVIISGVRFTYGKKHKTIDYPDITFYAGKSYAIVGENGCGKTTLLKILLGILKPCEGVVNGLKDEVIGFVPDYNGLYTFMTVLENIKFRLGLYNKKYCEEKDYIMELLEKYNLLKDKNKVVNELSLGMCKKVSIICALAVHPSILILDEPTGGLDADSQRELIQMLGRYISSNNMLICTSHDNVFLHEIEKLSHTNGGTNFEIINLCTS